jgi:hypothetical protein
MDKVEIRDDQVVSMGAIAPGLHELRITFVKPNVGAGGGMMSLLSPLYPRADRPAATAGGHWE